MELCKLCLNLQVALCLVGLLNVNLQILENTFVLNLDISNVVCHGEGFNISLKYSTRGCALLCSQTNYCRSFFYHSGDKFCQLSPDIFTSTAGCESKSGTEYYRNGGLAAVTTTAVPPAMFNDPCVFDYDCTYSNGACISGVCQCQAGYRHESASGKCVATCTTYGSSYTVYPDMELSVTYAEFYVDLPSCMISCTYSISCRGFTFCCGNMCRLKDATPLTNPADFYYMPGILYYSRNCA